WITNPYSRQLVHQWRSEEQAILVGTRTVLEDNPKLSTRDWVGKNPIRIVLDKDLKIGTGFHVLDKSVKTMVLTQEKDTSKYIDGIDYEIMDYSKPIASQICNHLHKHSITSVIVEGGAKTLQWFLDEALWDEARVFVGPNRFESGIPAPKFKGKLKSTQNIVSDTLSFYTHD
ncbi:MAG: RibD family protein, partial [Bacteroidota bacterium]|nr:RibD family protein [Bacteroidota bacterium]